MIEQEFALLRQSLDGEPLPAAPAKVAGRDQGGAGQGEGGKPQPSTDPQARDPNKPGQDRQNDILAAISAAETPLTRPELVKAMQLSTEGKLGHQLAWMMTNNILVNIPHRGYWPADRPLPE